MDRFRPGWVYDTTDLEPERGDTIEELAGKLGLNPQDLKQTLEEYNSSWVEAVTNFRDRFVN